MKKMLLASTSTIYGQKYLEYLHDEIKNLFSGCKKILFVPYARPSGISHLEYTEKAKNVFKILDLEIIDYTNEDLRLSIPKKFFLISKNFLEIVFMNYLLVLKIRKS